VFLAADKQTVSLVKFAGNIIPYFLCSAGYIGYMLMLGRMIAQQQVTPVNIRMGIG
jgi:hypothetical protein